MNETKLLQDIAKLNASLYGKDFLLTWDKTIPELKLILQTAALMKQLYENNVSLRIFDSGLAISNFRDNSTRTRFSFASASNLLGLAVQDLDEEKSQIAHGETVRETANMISFLSQVIGIRDDIYIGKGHTYMKEVAEALDEGYAKGVLPQRPGVINLQCDIDHPTQCMADLAWLQSISLARKLARQENRHDMGLQPVVWQAPFRAARCHRVDDPLRYERLAGAPRAMT